MNLLYHSMALASGRLEKPDTGIWNRNRKPNRNGKRNLYKNRDKIYLNLLQFGFSSYLVYMKNKEKKGVGTGT